MTTTTVTTLKIATEAARPLGVLPRPEITDQQLAVLRKIEEYEFPYVRERLIKKEILLEGIVDEAIFEFRRYFSLLYLVSGKEKSVGIFSEPVDEVWHNFILFTRLYTKFCHDTVGRYMHHKPGTSFTPIEPEAGQVFLKYYEMFFGEVPAIWRTVADCSTSTASTGDSGWSGSDD